MNVLQVVLCNTHSKFSSFYLENIMFEDICESFGSIHQKINELSSHKDDPGLHLHFS